MKKSFIIGLVLCIIALAAGVIAMGTGLLSHTRLVAITAIISYVSVSYLIGKYHNTKPVSRGREVHSPEHVPHKYDHQQHIMGL